MSTHNIHFHDKIKKNYLKCRKHFFLENFPGTQKRVRIRQNKRVIGVRVIGVLLYFEVYDLIVADGILKQYLSEKTRPDDSQEMSSHIISEKECKSYLTLSTLGKIFSRRHFKIYFFLFFFFPGNWI